MKKHFALIMMLLLCVGVHAESAKRILDKAAATVSNPGGVRAHFQMISKQFGNTNGEIAIKGKKFHATTAQATIWFDGKTQWTFVPENEEVNVTEPTDEVMEPTETDEPIDEEAPDKIGEPIDVTGLLSAVDELLAAVDDLLTTVDVHHETVVDSAADPPQTIMDIEEVETITIGLDGKTEDGSMPYTLLKKQLEYLR